MAGRDRGGAAAGRRAGVWGPVGTEPQLDEDYLLDPIRYAPFANTEAQMLEQLTSRPCLILLGPMGMGKSTTVDDEIARLAEAGGRVLAFDLLEFETASGAAHRDGPGAGPFPRQSPASHRVARNG